MRQVRGRLSKLVVDEHIRSLPGHLMNSQRSGAGGDGKFAIKKASLTTQPSPTHFRSTQAVNYLFSMTAAFYFAIKFENHVR